MTLWARVRPVGLAGIAALAAFVWQPDQVRAQSSFVSEQIEVVPEPEDEEKTPVGFREGSIIGAPILFEDPTVGTGLAVAGGYIFQADEESSTSFFGLAGLGTSNGTKAYGLAARLNFAENRWKGRAFAGEADVFYDLFLADTPVPLRQKGTLFDLGLAYGVTPELSFGAGVSGLNTVVSPDFLGFLPPELVPDANLDLRKINLDADWDRRDNDVFPRAGTNVAFDLSYGQTSGVSERSYTKAVLTVDGFYGVRQEDALAWRLAGCRAEDDAPFFDACLLGSDDAFRGYPSLQFIGTELLSLQLAYRGRIGSRFGYEVFAGTGQVFGRFGSLSDDAPQVSAGGVGLRFRLSEKFPVDYSVDFTRNEFGDDLLYVYIGQRF